MPDGSTQAELIPGIELGEELGRGGFAQVFRGWQRSVDRPVAVKIDNRVLRDDRNRRRFLREVTAAGRISAHPHVVSLIDAGTTTDGRPYLVMELCSGGTLGDLLRSAGPMHPADARDLGLAVVGAVVAAHEAGVLHRDIKPSNVLIDDYGTPRLADFGLAALPVPGRELSVTLEALTPAYAAPEAFTGQEPTVRSDVWSLGATIHAMISPYRSPRWSQDGSPAPIDQVIAHLATPLPDPGLPGSDVLMSVVARATHPDPAQRFASAREMHDALRALVMPPSSGGVLLGGPEASFVSLASVPRSSSAASVSGAPAKRARRVLPVLAAAAVGLLLGGVAMLGLSEWVLDEEPVGAAEPTASSGPDSSGPDSVEADAVEGGADEPADAQDATAELPPVGQCLGGMTSMNNIRTGSFVDCAEDHYYETYAVGVLDPATNTPYLNDVLVDPVVEKTCTEDAARAYLNDRKGNFEIDVLPPTEVGFIGGDKTFHCYVAEVDAGWVKGSLRD